jgi:hypothetical protein
MRKKFQIHRSIVLIRSHGADVGDASMPEIGILIALGPDCNSQTMDTVTARLKKAKT